MKVIVLGAGVIGVTSAWYLARAGHEVTVIDRQDGAGLETSFANAGEVSPGYASPWAGPGVPVKAIKWLLMRHGPLALRPRLDPTQWMWVLRMLANCTASRYAVNKARMVPIAEYSRDCLRALRAETGIAYDERALGTLQLFRTDTQVAAAHKDTEVLDAYGVPYAVLDAAGCIAAEPGLAAVRDKIAGGLRPASPSATARRSAASARMAMRSPASTPATGGSTPTPMSPRSAATRRSSSRRSALRCRSTRSRATRSPRRSSTPRSPRSRP